MKPVFNRPPDLLATVGARMLAARILFSPRPRANRIRACTVARATPSVTYFKTKKLVVSRHSSHKFVPSRHVTTRHSASNKSLPCTLPPLLSSPRFFPSPFPSYLNNPLLARAREISFVKSGFPACRKIEGPRNDAARDDIASSLPLRVGEQKG